jgi:hypothetical protein
MLRMFVISIDEFDDLAEKRRGLYWEGGGQMIVVKPFLYAQEKLLRNLVT